MKELLNLGKDVIKQYVDSNQLPGAVFSIVSKDDYVVDCYGYKSLVPQKEEVSLDTMYDLASLSKVVSTSIMILKLIEEGCFSFDTKVKDLLERFRFDDVVVLNLLNHTSGLISEDKNYKNCKNDKELLDFVYSLNKVYQTNTKVEYSCFNYILLGEIINKFKGNLERYATEVLFSKIDAHNMMYNPYLKNRKEDCAPTEVNDVRGVIKGIVHDGKCFKLNGLSGNAGLFSDIYGLVNFCQMMLNDGSFNNKTILKKETINQLKHCSTSGLNESRSSVSWFFADKNASCGKYISDCCLYHTGFSGTSIYIDYQRELAIILSSNAIHPNRINKMSEIREQFHNAILKE